VIAVAVSEKSTVPFAPVPVRVTLCGLPDALSVTLKVPVRVPEAVGVNVTLMLQFPPAANELPQLLDWPKSPLAAIPVMVSAVLPVLERVTVCAALVELIVWLANVSELGETPATGVPAAAPVPVRLTVCGLPEALSVTLKVPVRVPEAAGVNVTLMLQFPPAANELPQLLVWPKSPLAAIPVMVSAALPVLESVTVCAALVEFNVWLANVNDAGERLAPGVPGANPVPVRPTICGLPAALSVIVTAAPRAPAAVGVNVTLMVQFPLFAATELPQLFVCAKSPLFAPVTPMLVILRAALPVLVSATDCDPLVVLKVWPANVRLEADKIAVGAGVVVPVPLSVKECGLPVALSVIVTAAPRAPAAVGVNVTLMVQFPLFAATELPQVFVCAKSPLFAPVTPMLVILRAAFPVLVSVTDCDPLVVFNCWLAKVILDADKLTPGAGAPAPVPLSVKDCGLPVALSVRVTAAVRVPAADGVNVTLMLQFPPFAATELPQLFVCAKSPLFAPVIPRLLMLSAAFPVFVSVTVCAALVVFII